MLMVSTSILLPGKAASRRTLVVVMGCSGGPLPYREPYAFSMCSHVFFLWHDATGRGEDTAPQRAVVSYVGGGGICTEMVVN